MNVDRRITAGVILLGVMAWGPRAFSDPLEPPSGKPSGNSKVRWIRKTPAAPLPIVPAAPLPSGSSFAGIRQREVDKTADREIKAARVSRATTESKRDPVESDIRLAQSEAFPLLPGSSPGEPGMTLAEAESVAMANNPTLVQAAMRIRAAQGKCIQVGLYPNPIVGYEGDEMGAEGTAGQQGAFLIQEIVTAGKLQLASAVVGHEITQADQAWAAQQGRVLNDVRAAWYEATVAQRIVELNRQLMLIGQQGVQAAGELVEAMEVSRVDLLQARIEGDSAAIQLQLARNRHQAAWQRLAALLGVPELEPTRLVGDLEDELPELTWQGSLQRLLAGSPEVAEARAGVQRAQCVVARESARRIPNVNLRTGVRYHDSAEDTVATVEIGLPLPIFNRNQGNIYKAQAELIAAEKEVHRVELTLRDRLSAAMKRHADARHEVQQYARKILPNAKASLDLVRTGYREGEYDYLTLLTAQRTYFRVNLAYLESLLAYRSSRVSIEGFLLSGALDAARAAEEQ